MKGIFSVLVENKDGVLSGVSGLFGAGAENKSPCLAVMSCV